MAIVQEWLARSGQFPLSIRIFSTPNGIPSTSMHQTITALAYNIVLVGSILIFVSLKHYPYFGASNNDAPILESIRCHHSKGITEHNPATFG